MESGYFFSGSTGLYVARGPLTIDARVIKAAMRCDLKIGWDDEGRINCITFLEAMFLLQELGGTMMTMDEYWQVLRDAEIAGDTDMVKQLQSDRYAEWLNNVFERKEYAIERVYVKRTDRGFSYSGTKKEIHMPYGHPGWFNVEEINYESGLPEVVELNREKRATSWKYWSFCDYDYTAAAIRGWVTSVGKPSLDLGIPVNASQPFLMVRESRKELLRPPIEPQIMEQAEQFVADFEDKAQGGNYESYYKNRNSFLKFVDEHGPCFLGQEEMRIYKIREKIIEILGMLCVISRRRNDADFARRIAEVTRKLFGITESPDDRDFAVFIETSRARLAEASALCKDIIFVTGHKNPDTDTVVAAMAEAYRNHIFDGKSKVYIPVVQGSRMPDEISRLLGERFSRAMIFTDEKLYCDAATTGQARWIMVDHNRAVDIQKFAISIVDHHVPCEIALQQNIAKTIEIVGSTSALITQRLYGLGICLEKKLARILYGATLMDTENRSPLKMTAKDTFIMDDLREISETASDDMFYEDLMGFLLNSEDTELLFERDYKEDWTFFGFAVAKVKRLFDSEGNVLKPKLLEHLVGLARANNAAKNLPLTLIKVVDYEDDNRTVHRERVYLIFNNRAFPEFRETMLRLLEVIIRKTFHDRALIKKSNEFIEFWGVGDQLSRKRIVPLLEQVVTAFNAYFYSPSTELYVKRDFLKSTARVRKAAEKLNLELSWDEGGRINYLNYGEAMLLLEELGFTASSLNEYWRIYTDVKNIKDQQMSASMQSGGFVEFLHTVIEDGERLIEKPRISNRSSSFRYEGIDVGVNYAYEGGEVRQCQVPDGKPGLIAPGEIDLETGLPQKVHPPNIYNDPTLWRYWSPDAEKNVATRGYIFLLGQPALDLKMHLSESFYCLGVRPCSTKIELPEVEISTNDSGVSLRIFEEGEVKEANESDFFKNT